MWWHTSRNQISSFGEMDEFSNWRGSLQSNTGSRCFRRSVNAGYTMLRSSAKSSGYPLHSSVSLPNSYLASPCAIKFKLDSTSCLDVVPTKRKLLRSVCTDSSHNSQPKKYAERSPLEALNILPAKYWTDPITKCPYQQSHQSTLPTSSS